MSEPDPVFDEIKERMRIDHPIVSGEVATDDDVDFVSRLKGDIKTLMCKYLLLKGYVELVDTEDYTGAVMDIRRLLDAIQAHRVAVESGNRERADHDLWRHLATDE